MPIIGCDFHSRFQQIAILETETGELVEQRRLDHDSGEARAFYEGLKEPARVGIESTGYTLWVSRRPWTTTSLPRTSPSGSIPR